VTDDLITWLRAQFGDDEVVARRASTVVPAPWSYVEARSVILDAHARDIAKVGYVEGLHIARHDPARVLAEVEAKRRILDLYEELYEPGLYEAAALLALPCADRPGYQEAWRP